MRKLYVFSSAVAITAAFGLCIVKIQSQQAQIDRLGADMSALAQSLDGKGSRRREEGGDVMERRGSRAPARSPSLSPEDESDAHAPPPPQAPLEPKERPPADLEDTTDEIERVFLGEGSDPSWSRQTERTVKEKLTASLPEASAVRSIECRSSMCRVETVFHDPEAYGRFAQSAFKDPETRIWNGGAFSTSLGTDDRGDMVVISYLAREGEEIPSLDPQ
jgi:hypothetical protein